MEYTIHENDLPNSWVTQNLTSVAIDTETTGLNIHSRRDRLCLIQISTEDGKIALVKINQKSKKPENIINILKNKKCTKIFHFARFDVAALYIHTNTFAENIYCTKIASIIARTYSNKHGIKVLCQEFAKQSFSKAEQLSYWGVHTLSQSQIEYACNDVAYLHTIRQGLNEILQRENRMKLFEETINALKARIKLDLAGFEEIDVFHHRPHPIS